MSTRTRLVGGLRTTATACLLAPLAVSCDGRGGSSGPLPEPGFEIAPPAAVLAVRANDPSGLELAVTVDGRPVDAVRDGDVWRVSTSVPEGASVRVGIVWAERMDGATLTLASLERELGPFETDMSVVIDPADYDTSADADGDGHSNLAELDAGTDPFNGRDPGDVPGDGPGDGQMVADDPVAEPVEEPAAVPGAEPAPDEGPATSSSPPETARIYRFDASEGVPRLDGSFDRVWARKATFSDRTGRNLTIDRLLVDEGAEAGDGGVPYIWFAMHDGQYLYLFVQFERSEPFTPWRDSELYHHDDVVTLLFDGDASRGSVLDGITGDDRYFAISELPAPRESERVAFAPLPDIAPTVPPSLEFGVCICRSSVTGWEMRIALSDLGIEVGRPFGFEVQIHQDLDGGDRDALWGWAYPVPAERDEGFRHESPALAGTVVLLE